MAIIKTTYDEAVILHKNKFGYEPVIYGEFWSEPQEWSIDQFLDAIDSNIPYVETEPSKLGLKY